MSHVDSNGSIEIFADRLIPLDEAGEILSCSRSSVKRLIAEGTLEAVHIRPGSTRLRLSDVRRLVAEGVS